MLKQIDAYTPEVLIHMPANFASYTKLDQQIVAHDWLNPGFGVRRTFDLMVAGDSRDADLMRELSLHSYQDGPLRDRTYESLSGGNPSEKTESRRSEHRGITSAGSASINTQRETVRSLNAGEIDHRGAAQLADGNAESTRGSADRRSPDGQIENAVAGRE